MQFLSLIIDVVISVFGNGKRLRYAALPVSNIELQMVCVNGGVEC